MPHNEIDVPLIESMDALIKRAREISSLGDPLRVAVAAAHDEAVIDAVIAAQKEGIAEGILVGDPDKIIEILEKEGAKPGEFKVLATKNDVQTAETVAEACSKGTADLILKGLINTGTLLKSVLNQKYGLRREGGLLSHTAILSPVRYSKLLAVTDGGMVIKPTFNQKVEIIRNSVLVLWALGVKIPRVAVLAPIDQVIADFPETFEAAALSKMADRKQLKSCLIDGPMSFDTAVWPTTLEFRDIESPVAGHADIVVAQSIEQGNILAKSLVQFGDADFAGVIMGAGVPISLVSRADNAFNKMISIALAVVVSHYLKKV